VEADQKKQRVTEFFAGSGTDALQGVDYVLIGPRERITGTLNVSALPLSEVFRSGEVVVYTVRP
jgi:hypothetical protein